MILDALRRWLTRAENLPHWEGFVAWAREHRWTLKRSSSQDGWAMDDSDALPGWRIEWGPSQRVFMSAHELRIRLDLPQCPDAQVLVMDRPLFARMDHEVYQQVTDAVQTRIDDQMPEEMRWLAMHAKLGSSALGPLRERYGAVADDPAFGARWVAGPLADALLARAALVSAEASSSQPLMLRLARGTLLLRQGAENPDVPLLEACMQIALAAQESAPFET